MVAGPESKPVSSTSVIKTTAAEKVPEDRFEHVVDRINLDITVYSTSAVQGVGGSPHDPLWGTRRV